jgi:hypothetical protein
MSVLRSLQVINTYLDDSASDAPSPSYPFAHTEDLPRQIDSTCSEAAQDLLRLMAVVEAIVGSLQHWPWRRLNDPP